MTYQNANTARIGVHAVGCIVTEKLNWIFREQPIEDYGIDAHIEVCIDGKPTGRLIAVQIKCGESWFSLKSQEGFIFNGSMKHLEYWMSYSLPVILIMYNPIIKQALWVPIENERIQINKASWKIIVPFASYFDGNAKEMLSILAIPDYRKRKKIHEILHMFSGKDTLQTGAGDILDVLNKAEYCLDLVFPFIDIAFFWAIKTLSYRIKIRVITSSIMEEEVRHEIVQWLDESPGIEVRIWTSQDKGSVLHSKYLILDGKIVIYGSANFTKSSWRRSFERVLASDDQVILYQFKEQFNLFWMNSFTIDRIKEV